MKVWVNDALCRGHGVCVAVCPEIFTLLDDGYAEASEDEVPAELEGSVDEAITSCPEHAIERR
ncbi:MAG TPA: ferredoxin [Mycobacterium sp.]|nr:ferredoxin [Mycobacterium sp.]